MVDWGQEALQGNPFFTAANRTVSHPLCPITPLPLLSPPNPTPIPHPPTPQPYGREEPLITGRMWKHILVQGLYQLFWLFFFMYALPVLQWPRYHITSECELISRGPVSRPADPSYCMSQLTMAKARGGLGLDPVLAGHHCTLQTQCGYPCGAGRGSEACVAALAATGGGTFAVGAMPAVEREGFCPGGGGCPAYAAFRASEMFWGNKHEKQEIEDFKPADSLLFNSFIFCQVRPATDAGSALPGRGTPLALTKPSTIQTPSKPLSTPQTNAPPPPPPPPPLLHLPKYVLIA